VVDPDSNTVAKTIKPAGENVRPMGIAMSRDGKYVYVTTGRGGSVVQIDTGDDMVSKILEHVGPRPWGVAITPDGNTLYVANGPSNDAAVIDVKDWKVTQKIACGTSPWGVAIAP